MEIVDGKTNVTSTPTAACPLRSCADFILKQASRRYLGRETIGGVTTHHFACAVANMQLDSNIPVAVIEIWLSDDWGLVQREVFSDTNSVIATKSVEYISINGNLPDSLFVIPEDTPPPAGPKLGRR
jgi:hypothetical protein